MEQPVGGGRARGVVAATGVVTALLVGTVAAPTTASAAPVGPFPSPETFVQQAYRDLTGREARPDEYLRGVAAVSAGGTAPANLLARLVVSAPSRGVVFPVVRLYEAYFGRGPDTGGLAFWVDLVRSGTPTAVISDAFASSPEFVARYGALSNRAFVDRVYRNVLGRAPDPPGAAFWTGVLDSGLANRGQVMLGFSDSSEFARQLRAVVRVAAAYFGMLRRVPTGAEYDNGVALLAGGAPLGTLLAQLLASGAYASRIAGLCNASYLDFCLPPPPPDLRCSSGPLLGRMNFRVTGADPHNLDRDGDGVGCEAPPEVLLIGDSLLSQIADEVTLGLRGLGWTVTVLAANGTGLTAWANALVPFDWPAHLRLLDRAHRPRVVVIVLGTNDAIPVDGGDAYPPRIDGLLAVTTAERVCWADCSQRTAVAGRNRGCRAIAGALFDAKNRWLHLEPLPFDAAVAADPRHYGPDSVHLSQWGQDRFSELISRTVGPPRSRTTGALPGPAGPG